MEIEFEGEMYTLYKKTENIILFKRIEKLNKYNIKELAEQLKDIEIELKDSEEEASEHQRLIDEYRFCGYNEEDQKFHGMCVFQNHLDDKVNELEEKYSRVLQEIEKRIRDSSDVAVLLNKYDIEY